MAMRMCGVAQTMSDSVVCMSVRMRVLCVDVY